MNKISTSYLLWLCWFAGFAGLQRIYNKQFITGALWFFTWGLFGIGQIVDLLLIPSMVDEHNLKLKLRLGSSPQGIKGGANPIVSEQIFTNYSSQFQIKTSSALSPQEKMVVLAQAAASRGGKLSVTQAVIDTGIPFEQVEQTMTEMMKKGYIAIDNHPRTGVVIYDFLELS